MSGAIHNRTRKPRKGDWSAAEKERLEPFITRSSPDAVLERAFPGRSARAIRCQIARLREERGLSLGGESGRISSWERRAIRACAAELAAIMKLGGYGQAIRR